uniref:Uncharacterized protein n=1 Tax=Arundo donax TaxID=35708 RepID=A0A0A9F8U0_ARUDO
MLRSIWNLQRWNHCFII